ncbi:MAG: glycoside hydrolase family 9 protein [Armatimonas sp.]
MSRLIELTPTTDRILLLRFSDGYIEHHKRGQPRSQERVVLDNPLTEAQLGSKSAYSVEVRGQAPMVPVRVARKSKGVDFAWFTDKWENNRAVNTRPDHIKEHWVYLFLPAPLKQGVQYIVSAPGNVVAFTYDPVRTRSETVHVNTLGYVPDAPQKFGYLYQWMGDGGSLDLKAWEGKPFQVLERKTRKSALSGVVRFRKSKDNQETFHLADTPKGNFLGADVWECDFSKLTAAGEYVLSVPGIGCSLPFRIDPDVYRPAFVATTRALYHNRSGIALTKPYTEFERPAPHHPKLTPGFAGKLRYTRVRYTEWGSEGGDAKKLMDDSPGALDDSWGWYQDAGDWDSYVTHLRPAQELLLVYSMAPANFAPGEFNLPESNSTIPDILHEAAWLPRFCARLRKELVAKGWGTGGVGLRVAGDAFGTDEGTLPNGQKVGRGSWEDTDRTWMVSGEDPWSTLRYAGVAANLARFLPKDPQGIDWEKEARECYAWGLKNTKSGDEQAEGGLLKACRAYAAASLFVLTGEAVFEEQLEKDTADIKPDTLLYDENRLYAASVYVLQAKGKKTELQARLRAAILTTAEETMIKTLAKRALRWGGNFSFPMLVGHQTTPWALEGAVAYTLTNNKTYLAALYTTCDYFLGTNALNQTWITGVGPRFPQQVFHMDAWYNGKGKFHPGLIPYGPWRKQKDEGQGPWDSDWHNKSLYPPIDAWPGNERWFSNRCSPLNCEFTIHQNIGPAAAIFGFLCGKKRK